jgi:hypothetical protein
MRTRASLGLVVLLVCFFPAVAHAGGPGAVYSDFVQDGKLSCNHSRADLNSVLHSGTLNQYGDPLTLARLKLAVREQLAGGCRKQGASSPPATTTGTTTTGQGGTGKHAKPKHPRAHPRAPDGLTVAQRQRLASSDNGSFLAGRGLALGLLAAAIAFGGWLTKHALSARG